MILFLITALLNIQTVSAQSAANSEDPPLRYILDEPTVKSSLLEVNRGCLSRRSTKICDCFMKNFKRKVNGRDIMEKDMPLLIDVAYRRKEQEWTKKSDFYYFIKDMMEVIEAGCTKDSAGFELDLGGDEISKSTARPKNDKAPASTPKPSTKP